MKRDPAARFLGDVEAEALARLPEVAWAADLCPEATGRIDDAAARLRDKEPGGRGCRSELHRLTMRPEVLGHDAAMPTDELASERIPDSQASSRRASGASRTPPRMFERCDHGKEETGSPRSWGVPQEHRFSRSDRQQHRRDEERHAEDGRDSTNQRRHANLRLRRSKLAAACRRYLG